MELFIMILLVLTSVVSVTFIVERGLALRRRKVIPLEVQAAVTACQGPGDVPSLRRICESRPSALSRLLAVAAEHLDWPKPENIDAVQTRARHEVVQLERGLVVLEIVVGIAPLMGLVGTIYGLITLFGGLGQSGISDNAGFASGISIALNATMMGLMIAIPSLVAWSYYSNKVENLAVEMATLCDTFMRRQYHGDREK